APRQLDPPRLRHRQRPAREGARHAHPRSRSGRHPAAARRARGPDRQGNGGHSRGVATPARRARRCRSDAGYSTRRAGGRRPAGTRGMTPLLFKHFTATSCIGRGLQATLASLQEQRSGLAPCAFETVTLQTHIGEVPGIDSVRLPAASKRFDCRNNRLAQLGIAEDGFLDAVAACVGRWGRDRVGLFLGTSTSGMLETEIAYRQRDPQTGALPASFAYAGTHNSYSLAAFVQELLCLEGPSAVVSSACSSSAKVFGSARRMIAAGLIDAAVVGGVDSLCLTTLYGFHSLQLVSPNPCKPFDVTRDGISIGEAAAFALIERPPDSLDSDATLLLGVGESSDAYHMSSPHPEGRGARAAMLQALD